MTSRFLRKAGQRWQRQQSMMQVRANALIFALSAVRTAGRALDWHWTGTPAAPQRLIRGAATQMQAVLVPEGTRAQKKWADAGAGSLPPCWIFFF